MACFPVRKYSSSDDKGHRDPHKLGRGGSHRSHGHSGQSGQTLSVLLPVIKSTVAVASLIIVRCK